ncbi:trimeric intracellular cation channel family protein [Bowmanella sp. Y26]|uniref:trimeric intracellular cation channel family protein n=1 Tax=Bowmanella yangjiangensis TaxID=2811230 RepID=UPI001BDD8125|nr:trimeric intracellular cation channel family protein [Bowmanella yangjiangensis]MBT1063938.1 trimeric intracellular cation channel family protein [Bowmanella yangjiangensis]
MSHWLHWIDLLGVAVFAISGTLMAYRKHMDGFGVIVLASVTAIGGGTLRDMILDLPVFWVQQPDFLYAILVAAIITILWLRITHKFPYQTLLIADAIGIAFFNIMGLQKALDQGTGPFIAIVMGTMTGVFGGLIRDVICREIPLVLKGELYATTCIVGGLLYVSAMSLGVPDLPAMILGMAGTLLLRLGAIRWHWQLPVFQGSH